MKSYGLTIREALCEVSYANLILMGASLPSYEYDNRETNKAGQELNEIRNPTADDLDKLLI